MNNEDMSELFSKFSNMINEGNIPDEMKNILSSISSSNTNDANATNNYSSSSDSNSNQSTGTSSFDTSSIDFETILKMKSMMEKLKNTNDPRANLLLSLKPYLKESRKEKVDQYVKFLNMSKVLELFNNSGGEVQK